jgi:hypothetical protein
MLGPGRIDGHHRKLQRAVGGHGAQTDDAGRRLLRSGQHVGQDLTSLLVQQRHQVTAVIHGQLWPRVGHSVEVGVVRITILAAAGERADAVLDDQRRRHIVLGGQWVGCAQ